MGKKLREKADKKRAERNSPIVSAPAEVNAETRLEAPADIPQQRYRPLEKVEAVSGMIQTDDKPKNTISTSAPLAPVVGQAVVKNDTSAPVNAATKPLTFSDMLEAQRQNIVKDKTDAVKMQKYYALTDALKALGQMGGAAVGGAIGGGVLDSAPSVPEYKESRGYLDAVERARKADDRLRALEEQDFNLAYSKQQRDEERAYNEKNRKEEREYQAEQNRLNREYQAEQARITREWNKAVADGDFARKAELEKELLSLKNRYAAADDQRSKDYLQKQYDLYNPSRPVMFADGTMATFSSQQLEDMLANFKGKTIGGEKVTKDNFADILRKHPEEFADYFSMIGITASKPTLKANVTVAPKGQTPAPTGNHSFPTHISQIPEGYVVGSKRATGVPVNPNLKTTEKEEIEGVEWL